MTQAAPSLAQSVRPRGHRASSATSELTRGARAQASLRGVHARGRGVTGTTSPRQGHSARPRGACGDSAVREHPHQGRAFPWGRRPFRRDGGVGEGRPVHSAASTLEIAQTQLPRVVVEEIETATLRQKDRQKDRQLDGSTELTPSPGPTGSAGLPGTSRLRGGDKGRILTGAPGSPLGLWFSPTITKKKKHT